MLITSSQQISDCTSPGVNKVIQNEFEQQTLIFGSYMSIILNKRINFLQFLKLILEDKRVQSAYLSYVYEPSLQAAVREYIYSTPNICKKIFNPKKIK